MKLILQPSSKQFPFHHITHICDAWYIVRRMLPVLVWNSVCHWNNDCKPQLVSWYQNICPYQCSPCWILWTLCRRHLVPFHNPFSLLKHIFKWNLFFFHNPFSFSVKCSATASITVIIIPKPKNHQLLIIMLIVM